jgi:putative drug exporter of the RND superfamily
MAVAVAVDATVVRCVLVPAIMSLLGSSGWWLPKWMEHATPKFSIEGNEWFAEYEAPAEQANALQARPEGPTSPTAPTDRRPPQIGRTINAESSACSSPRMLAERKPET